MNDLHTHILPGMDDGAQTVEESLKLLYALWEQDVKKVVLSPHFYAHMETAETFLNRRQTQAELLKKAVERVKIPLPSGYLGAEVQVTKNLLKYQPRFTELCISGTAYMLVEPPYMYWENWMYETIQELINEDIVPIIAHIERFLRFNPKENIDRLMSMDVLLQSNASSYRLFKKRRFLYPLIKREQIHSFVSDAHNLRTRFPEMDYAERRVLKRFGQECLDRFNERSEAVLADATPLFTTITL